MGGSTSVNESSGSSQSAPLTASQRSGIYQGAIGDISSTDPSAFQNGTFSPPPAYAAPTYATSGTPQQIDGGNLQQLQSQMTSGYDAGTQYQQNQANATLNSNLAARGIWSSGLAQQAMQNQNDSFNAQYAQNGANATNAADSLQNSQNQSVNALAQQNANAQNTFNLANAQQNQASQWAPLTYLQGLWNGTGGQTSSSQNQSFGFGISGGVGGGT